MTDQRLSRRRLLGTLGSGTLVGIAGCLGLGTELSPSSSGEATTHASDDAATDAGSGGQTPRLERSSPGEHQQG